MKYYITILFFAMSFLASCVIDDGDFGEVEFPEGPTEAYRAVYAGEESVDIAVEGPRLISNPGKIYVYNNLFFLNERSEGLHIIERGLDGTMERIAFLYIPGNIDVAVRNNLMYADYQNHLAVFSLTDPTSPSLEGITYNVFDESDLSVPPESGVFFECVDPSRGDIIFWEKTTINSPACYLQ